MTVTDLKTRRQQKDSVPPNDVALERAVIGALLNHADAIGQIAEICKADDFYTPIHKDIFRVMVTLGERREPTDVIHVAFELRQRGDRRENLESDLITLSADAPSLISATSAAKTVSDLAQLRNVQETGKRITQMADSWAGNIEETIADAQALVKGLGDVTGPNVELEFMTIGQLAESVDAKPHPGWLAQPVWPADSYGVIAAEQKLGKTWMVLDFIVSAASGSSWLGMFDVERPGPVVVFLGEGGERKMLRRLRAIAATKRVNLESLPIHLCMRVPHLTSESHMAIIEDKVNSVKPVLVVVDPLYLAARGAKGSDLYAMGEHLEGLQHIAQTANSALVVVHHWNKTGDGTGAGRMSGAGPAEWGRVLVSMSALSKSTDPESKETTVVVSAEFMGDEIPDFTYRFRRRVRASNPGDLNSPLRYNVEEVRDIVEQASSVMADVHECKSLILNLPGISTSQLTQSAILKMIPKRDDTVKKALDMLVQEGSLLMEIGKKNSKLYTLRRAEQTALRIVNDDGEIIDNAPD